ncbi:unnamed protein product [Chilo suppressalis]|uniref:C2 domain-containing protein n=1 Tax=Chilo suppressalis TaxID=168631 RepID=A0ABN8B429_CHISP|nr:unnamed protein product [Chilo suppressalis]
MVTRAAPKGAGVAAAALTTVSCRLYTPIACIYSSNTTPSSPATHRSTPGPHTPRRASYAARMRRTVIGRRANTLPQSRKTKWKRETRCVPAERWWPTLALLTRPMVISAFVESRRDHTTLCVQRSRAERRPVRVESQVVAPAWCLLLRRARLPMFVCRVVYGSECRRCCAVEATAYISVVAALSTALLVVVLLLGRRWCHAAPHRGLRVSVPPPTPLPPAFAIHDAQFDALSKPNHYPERIFTFEASDSDEELRLRIQQDKEEVECHYEEKNENQAHSSQTKLEVELVETALRETRIDDAAPAPVPLPSPRAPYLHSLEAQSSVDSDVIAHNDTSLLCGESSGGGGGGGGGGQERGCVELTLLYDAPVRCMTVHVLQARGLPSPAPPAPAPASSPHAAPSIARALASPVTAPLPPVLQTQVRIVLLPLKKQKFKSKIRNGENPQYMESFVLHKINPEDVHGLGLRIRIYGCERMRRHRLIGEAAVSFNNLHLELENCLWLQLAPRKHNQPPLQLPKLEMSQSMSGVLASPSTASVTGNGGGESCSLARSESASSCCSARSSPELLLGLQYSPNTGHLSVEVIKGTHFRKLSPNKAPDTYVKLILVSSRGMQLARCKSTTRRAQSNPLYKELFIFQVALFQLSEVTLMVSVWWRRSVKRNEMVGWCALGHASSTSDARAHWDDLCHRQGEQVQRWHVLLES